MPPKKKAKVEEEAAAKAAAAKAAEEKKRKAESPEEPAAKKEAKKEAPLAKAKPEASKKEDSGDREKDAPADKRPAYKGQIGFNPSDCTLNAMPSMGGNMIMALSEGGMQYLIAGARANVGIVAGRYMYEVKIVEALNPSESSSGAKGRVPMPRQLARLGFSTAGSSLVLGDGKDCICFDSEGSLYANGEKKAGCSQRFTRDQVVGVLLNVDLESPTANTVSLFVDGVRVAEPQPLPEHLHGQALFPHVSFRNVTMQMMWGPQPTKALPFKCRTLQGAANEDVSPMVAPPLKDGKHEVVLPVGFPDEGTFDWLDGFLAENPEYVELSDRKIMQWAISSGMWKPRAGGPKSSNDKPEFTFGLTGMDDFSIRRVVDSIAPLVPRNYVVMEVKSNLTKADRAQVLKRFGSQHYKKVAHVVMGEPKEEYKKMQLDKLLREKQEKANAEWKAKKAELEKKKQAELRQKQLLEMRKKAEEARKKAAEEAKKKAEEAKKKAEEARAKAVEAKRKAEAGETDEAEEPKEEETKEEAKEETKEEPKEEVKEETKEEEEKEEVKEEEPEETEPPTVELTEEEQKLWFGKSATPDLTPAVLSASFGSFTVPEEDEGFDEVRYEWDDADKSKDYLRTWVLERKRTSRIEDLEPSAWFREKLEAWQKSFTEWQKKQKAFKPAAKEKSDGTDGEEAEQTEAETVDIFSVADVCDVGGGEPLFTKFAHEDWALLLLRFELYTLQLAFKKDVDDPERVGIHETHLSFYYNKYYRKQLNPKLFGLSTNAELVKLAKDCVKIDGDTLASNLEDDKIDELDHFVKLTEENRRERQRRIDAGDETAKLKFSPLAVQAASTRPAAPAGQVAGAGAAPAWQAPGKGGANWRGPATPGWQRPGGKAGWR